MSFNNKHKEKLWDVLWESAIGGLAIVAENGRFLKANPAFCRIVEYSELELVDKKFQDITLPGDREPDVELAEEVVAGSRKSYDMVKSYMTKTRRVVWVHLRVVPYMDDNGKFCYFVSQVYEVPVTAIANLGVDPKQGEAYALRQVTPSLNWGKVLDFAVKWLPFIGFVIGAGVIGIGFLLGAIGFQVNPPV